MHFHLLHAKKTLPKSSDLSQLPWVSSHHHQVPFHSGCLWAWNSWRPWHRCRHTPCQADRGVRCWTKSPDYWHRIWCCRTSAESIGAASGMLPKEKMPQICSPCLSGLAVFRINKGSDKTPRCGFEAWFRNSNQLWVPWNLPDVFLGAVSSPAKDLLNASPSHVGFLAALSVGGPSVSSLVWV